MSQATLKKLILTLVAALAAWGIVTIFSGRGAPAGGGGALAAALESVDSEEAIRTVRIERPGGESFELARGETGWRVNGMVADSGIVARLLDVIDALEVAELVARNPATHARMGMTEEKAYRLAISTGGGSFEMLVGNTGSRSGTTYARLPEEDEVYLVEGNLQSQVRRTLPDWRSKRVVAVDTSTVASIEVRRDGEAYTLERADSSWTLAGESDADPTAVANILQELRDLRAGGFLAEGDSLAAMPQGGSVIAKSADGAELASVELGSGSSERWARVAGDTVTYRLAGFRVDRVAPRRERVRSAN